ncbi:LacI family transcriptional regulator [Sphingobacterium psychroaquaticum]|nr:LacI family transcriptional regulator [Sphingobacterium psychroaquaticum]
MAMQGNVTIKTVAQETGLSLTTVSRVLNGTAEKYRISEATQAAVLAEAKKQGYIPNMAAKTLRLNKSRTIGLIVPTLNNPFFSLVASTVSKLLYAQGYVVLMSDCANDPEEERKLIKTFLTQNIEGILAIPVGGRKNYELLEKGGVPTVFIDRFFEESKIPYVATDHFDSAFKLMEHLVEHGHTLIACIQGDVQTISNQYRVKGYLEALKKHNIGYSYLKGGSFTTDEGYLETKILLKQSQKPTAIMALSDTILLGALKAIREEGMSIPEDISVVSIDNSSYLDFLSVPITSVSHPITEITQLAIKMLLDQMGASQASAPTNIVLEAKLIARKSVQYIP